MKYKFELSSNFVKISNYDTNEVLYCIPGNLITYKKLSATDFSFNVSGENLYTVIPKTDVMVPDNTLFGDMDSFLLDLSSSTNVSLGLTIGQALNIQSAMP